MRGLWKSVCAAALLLAVAAPAAEAAVVFKSVETLSRDADTVMVGLVENVTYEVVRPGMAYTRYEIRSLDCLKGHCTSRDVLTLRLPGGQAPEAFVHASDIPVFEQGQVALLFVNQREDGFFWAHSGFMGGRPVVDGSVFDYVDTAQGVQVQQVALDSVLDRVRVALSAQ